MPKERAASRFFIEREGIMVHLAKNKFLASILILFWVVYALPLGGISTSAFAARETQIEQPKSPQGLPFFGKIFQWIKQIFTFEWARRCPPEKAPSKKTRKTKKIRETRERRETELPRRIKQKTLVKRASLPQEEPSSFEYDYIPPQILELTPEDGSFTNNPRPTIRVQIEDDFSGPNWPSLKITLDGLDLTEQILKENSLSGKPQVDLKEGEHTLTIRIQDEAGNLQSLTSFFTVDLSPPDILGFVPEAGELIEDLKPLISCSYLDKLSDIDLDSIKVIFDGRDVTRFTQITVYGLTYSPEEELAAGQHRVVVELKDIAGNSIPEVEWQFSIAGEGETITQPAWGLGGGGDFNPPQILSLLPADGSFTNDSTPLISATYRDDLAGVDVGSIRLLLDRVVVSDEASLTSTGLTYVPKSPLFDGTHRLRLTLSDKAGNKASRIQSSFVVDTIPPRVVITSPQDGATVIIPEVTLAGTIDGIAFSELITLTEGLNILTKEATDLAGNSRSSSITITLHPGVVIGSSGGTAASPDGRAEVVIPPGALTSPTRITVINQDIEPLKDSAPPDTELLSAVDFGPDGLTFQKPVEITIPFEESEVPGTPIELGLYDPSTNTFEPTGITAPVGVDNYSATFEVEHFSTYGALKSLIPTGAPMGSGIEIPAPDLFTGAFSHSVPITVAPGRKGIQPNLALVYRSSNPNSWAGLGFSLNPGYIVRSTRLGPPTYVDTQDTFYFVTDAGTTELVHLIENLYQAKIESSFAKFFKEENDSWLVVDKNGSKLRFGQNDNSKEVSPQGTYRWHLTKAVDTNGNYIEYEYTKSEGKSYLSRIDYTGNENGTSPTNSVEFFLESREDIPSSYISGAKIATTKRLKEIEVTVNYELVWRYILKYDYCQDTNRSLLESITQYGAHGKAFPTQTFNYQKAK